MLHRHLRAAADCAAAATAATVDEMVARSAAAGGSADAAAVIKGSGAVEVLQSYLSDGAAFSASAAVPEAAFGGLPPPTAAAVQKLTHNGSCSDSCTAVCHYYLENLCVVSRKALWIRINVLPVQRRLLTKSCICVFTQVRNTLAMMQPLGLDEGDTSAAASAKTTDAGPSSAG